MEDYVVKYIGCTKALLSWFHAAHHVTKGSGFAGDHVNLYGEIYNGINEDFDALVEKFIVVCDTEKVACPLNATLESVPFLMQFTSPVDLNPDAIAAVGLQFMRHHVDHLTKLYHQLESKRLLTLGADDYLAAAANQYEKYVYLLGQRVKSGRV
jgi:hypothetical protein|tara:strand:- start:1598 stop:2059 length:462 start_codon:yes stop_codon:yes gene_type:complete